MNNKTKTERSVSRAFICLALSILTVIALFPVGMTVHAEDVLTVYVSPSGSDSGSGTKASPFQTVKRALTELAANGTDGGGTVVFMGDVESSNTKSLSNTTLSSTTLLKNWKHPNALVTYTGRDPATGQVYANASLHYDAFGLRGPVKLEYLNMYPSRESLFINGCGYEMTYGQNVSAVRYVLSEHCGIGETVKTNVSSTSTVIDGGKVSTLFLAGGYPTKDYYGVTGDIRLTVNDGSVGSVVIGFDSYLSTHVPATVGGNVYITYNGGSIGSVTNKLIKNSTIGGALMFVANNNMQLNISAPKAAGGIYTVYSGNHGKAEIVSPGVINIKPTKGYAAYIDGENVPAGKYTLTPGTTYITYIHESMENNLKSEEAFIKGYPDGTFRPNETITRAEALRAVLATRSITVTDSAEPENPFSDISRSDWYYDDAVFAYNAFFLPESWGDVFDANVPITRGEFAYIIYMITPEDSGESELKLFDFDDVDTDDEFYSAISSLAQKGYVHGYDDNTFRPEKTITRAEAVSILARVLGRTATDEGAENAALDGLFPDISSHWAKEAIICAGTGIGDGLWEYGETDRFNMPTSGGAEVYVKALYEQSKSLSAKAIRNGVDVIAEKMKDEIINSPNTLDIYGDKITGTVYYVSENGNDNNSGRSPEKPIKSLSKVQSIMSAKLTYGDAVLFERGSMFRGTITAKAGVTIGAYGVGDKPVIVQSKKNYATSRSWVSTEWKNVWRSVDKLKNVGVIAFDHDVHEYGNYDATYGKIMNRGLFGFTGPADLKNNLEFYSDLTSGISTDNYVYLYCDMGNPGDVFETIEMGENIAIVNGAANDFTIDNISFKYTGGHGMGGAGGCKNRTVTNCIYSWLGGSILSESFNGGGPVNYGNAIEIYGSCDGYFVENNWMYQIYDTAVTHQFSGTSNCIQQHVRYIGNLMEYCHWGIEFYNAPGNTQPNDYKYTKDVYDAYNVLRVHGYGWGSIVRSRRGLMYCGSSLSYNTDELTEYNIFDRCHGELIHLPANAAEVDDKNIYIQTIGESLGWLKGTTYTCTYDAHHRIRDALGDRNAVVIAVVN